jgi:hypothetical protein
MSLRVQIKKVPLLEEQATLAQHPEGRSNPTTKSLYGVRFISLKLALFQVKILLLHIFPQATPRHFPGGCTSGPKEQTNQTNDAQTFHFTSPSERRSSLFSPRLKRYFILKSWS